MTITLMDSRKTRTKRKTPTKPIKLNLKPSPTGKKSLVGYQGDLKSWVKVSKTKPVEGRDSGLVIDNNRVAPQDGSTMSTKEGCLQAGVGTRFQGKPCGSRVTKGPRTPIKSQEPASWRGMAARRKEELITSKEIIRKVEITPKDKD